MTKALATAKQLLVPVKFSTDEFEFMLIKGGIKVNGKIIYQDTTIYEGDKVELLKFPNLLLYYPIEDNSFDFIKRIDINWKQLEECDKRAKASGSLVGRYISEPFADGKAIYQIIKENKKTVRIRVCTGIGDDWKIPYWGDETSVGIEYARKKLKYRDGISELFSKNKKGI